MRRHIDPDEIFLDSQNLPDFDDQQFEGRIEKPISKPTLYLLGVIFTAVFVFMGVKVWNLQVVHGAEYAEQSENNRLRHIPFFAERGIVYDRNKVELAWNDPERKYIDLAGMSHIVGYVGYPTEKELGGGSYYPDELVGRAGAEKVFNYLLLGTNGIKIIEEDVAGKSRSESVYRPPTPGSSVVLSIDSRLQNALYNSVARLAVDRGFEGGGGVIIDVKTGEIVALASYPEYDAQILSDGDNKAAISAMVTNDSNPFLDRVVSGVYTPGSIVKPFMAIAALAEGVITPEKQIVSTGKIEVPNPYKPGEKTVFKDWKAHGAVDMRHALAVSSDVYFYEVGGGFENQKGVGIRAIEKYMKMFGLGSETGVELDGESDGVIPSPEWKAKMFDGEQWVLGNTYHTSIGQYGFQVTPLQMARAVAAIATDGNLVQPTILKTDTPKSVSKVELDKSFFEVAKEGMRLSAEIGTASAMSGAGVKVAAKTGTAELGIKKVLVNSWVTGFFPYDTPRYAFALVMEKGDVKNTVGATVAMRSFIDWLCANAPEYIEPGV